jgi:hypothetical protein
MHELWDMEACQSFYEGRGEEGENGGDEPNGYIVHCIYGNITVKPLYNYDVRY